MATGPGNATATVTRWSRAFVAVGVGFFLAWQVAVATGLPRAATVPLGVFGFVLHVVFGKAYTLVPSYFARELAVPHAPAVHLPFALAGTAGAFAAGVGLGPPILGAASATSWLVGCLVFVAVLGWTVRDNPTGRETGTGATETRRKRVDRLANAALPVVFAYLLVGASLSVVGELGLEPPVLPASGPAVTHVFAAGTAALLVFAIGFRLLPRLLVASVNPLLVSLVVGAGIVGPALLAVDFRGGSLFRVGAGLQATALVGFGVAVVGFRRQTDRRRVGGWAILAGAASGVLVAALGLAFAFLPASSVPATAFDAHYRLAVGGFLGLTIVGVTYHFYPPAVASVPGIGDRTARASVVALVAGLGLAVVGSLGAVPPLVGTGQWLSVLGAILYAGVLWTIFLERAG
ncbi:hypothetical protein [Natrinema longum]|uniref:Uncharacterized protein n=1 Tax=Natrinema longum TaxID=370324 RepID=A0A8A2UB10_9EURY|nr:hypothetical protein [Natrinema longum]MBZ6496302.1 hypothetical protein [Natrinema longum]QSW85783.1 hypothetical protein J0X27_02795 [Natrinema longum]